MRRLPSVLSAALVLALAGPAAAGTVSVNTDTGPSSLRQVLAAANDGDTIDFALAPGTKITLTTGELPVTTNLTIAGPGVDALTIDGSDAARVLHVAPGKTVTIANLTVTHGKSPDANADGGGCIYNENATLTLDHVAVQLCTARYGAGVLNDGEDAPAVMLIRDSTIADNTTTSASGGGIYNDGSTPTGNATLEVVRSTISGNEANGDSDGGGIYNDGYEGHATLKIHASTISNNTSSQNGGGLASGAFLAGVAAVQISNSTFSNNVAELIGDAIFNQIDNGGMAAGIEIGNTLLVAPPGGGDTIANSFGAVSSLGFNFANNAAGGDTTTGPGGLLNGPGDRRNTDALLGPLLDNGGPTETNAPQPGSPVIDQGKRDTIPALADTTDQRALIRPFDDPTIANASGGDGSDIGAFEVQATQDLAVTQLKPPSRVTLKASAPTVTKKVKVQIQNRSGAPVTVPDLATLAALVEVDVTPIAAGCFAPVATLVPGKPNKVPATLKPKKKLTAVFTVTLDCAVDPLKTSKKTPGHDDFRWTATLHASAIAGIADTHAADDVCPRSTLPGGGDPRPDAKKPIKDKGCGGKLPNKTLGADVTTDVVVK